ncbi:MAG: hypothetical protein AAB392_01860 [Patescibacteria group bacterium]
MKDKLLVLFLIVLIALGYWGYRSGWFKGTQEEEEVVVPPKVTIEYVEPGKLAPLLPTDLPLEEGAPMQRNEIVRTVDSREEQQVYRYYSKKTVEENFEIYSEYLEESGWAIKNSTQEATSAFILAEKEGKSGAMQVSVSKNSITDDITVEISITIRK